MSCISHACTFVILESVSNIVGAHALVRWIALVLENVIHSLWMHSLCVEKFLSGVKVESFLKNLRLLTHNFGTE